jgi:hypothetical protein
MEFLILTRRAGASFGKIKTESRRDGLVPDSFPWAIFKDEQPTGVVERKCITDIISRPYPQTVAGTIYGWTKSCIKISKLKIRNKLKSYNISGSCCSFVQY